MTNLLKYKAQIDAFTLIENQSETKARGIWSTLRQTPRGGVAVVDLSPPSPTPFMILALSGGRK